MSGSELKAARKKAGMTQVNVSRNLRVSQGYVSLLENGSRRVPAKLAKRFASLYCLAPTALPMVDGARRLERTNPETLAEELGALGYPGFSYLRSRRRKNPAEVLLAALSQADLESRLAEALPWVLLHYAGVDKKWLVDQSRLHNLQNRLGFVVRLAREAAGGQDGRLQGLAELESELEVSRLAREDTFCQESLSQAERQWLRNVRTPEAQHWNLLTDWRPEALRYA